MYISKSSSSSSTSLVEAYDNSSESSPSSAVIVSVENTNASPIKKLAPLSVLYQVGSCENLAIPKVTKQDMKQITFRCLAENLTYRKTANKLRKTFPELSFSHATVHRWARNAKTRPYQSDAKKEAQKEALKKKVLQMAENKYTYRQIKAECGIHLSKICRIVKASKSVSA